jgi:hypothetical protein
MVAVNSAKDRARIYDPSLLNARVLTRSRPAEDATRASH